MKCNFGVVPFGMRNCEFIREAKIVKEKLKVTEKSCSLNGRERECSENEQQQRNTKYRSEKCAKIDKRQSFGSRV